MASFEEGLRHFWLRDIHRVCGVTGEELRHWLDHEKFILTQVNGSNNFTLRVLDPAGAKRAIAHDSTRMASAAFETMMGINAVGKLPKSTAWILIRAYYGAFFAAHSLLRTLGITCTQLDSQQTIALDHVGNATGILPGAGFEKGFYIAKYDTRLDEIHFYKSLAARKGSHEILWETFADKLRVVSNYLLSISSAFTTIALQLSEIDTHLRQEGQNNGSWLSYIRNLANYRHEYGLWFPYAQSQVDSHELIRIIKRWDQNPSKMFPVNQSNSIILHIWICTVIVSICHAVAIDIELHAPKKKCFHSFGSLALTRLAAA